MFFLYYCMVSQQVNKLLGSGIVRLPGVHNIRVNIY